MAETHTPGPWSWSEDATSEGYFLIRGGETNVCIMQERFSDMGMESDPTRDEAIYNANLIASAPDLLKMLKVAQLWLDIDGRYDVQGINAAIAKVEGRTP